MVATLSTCPGFQKTKMLSAIIATNESERTLVATLAALVPGATAGLLGEVVRAACSIQEGEALEARRRRLVVS